MLRRGRGKGAANLSVKRTASPEPARLIQESSHLRRHPAKARGRADDDGVVVSQLRDFSDRRGLLDFEVRRLGDFERHSFRNALHVDRCACRAGALSDRLRHGLNVTVGRIVEDEDF